MKRDGGCEEGMEGVKRWRVGRGDGGCEEGWRV